MLDNEKKDGSFSLQNSKEDAKMKVKETTTDTRQQNEKQRNKRGKHPEAVLQETAEKIIGKKTANEVFLRPNSSLDVSEMSFTTVPTIRSHRKPEKQMSSRGSSQRKFKRPNPFGTLKSEKSNPHSDQPNTQPNVTNSTKKVLSMFRISKRSGYTSDFDNEDLLDDSSYDSEQLRGFRVTLDEDNTPPDEAFREVNFRGTSMKNPPQLQDEDPEMDI